MTESGESRVKTETEIQTESNHIINLPSRTVIPMTTVPRVFTGEVNSNGRAEDPGNWLDYFELVSELNEWYSDRQKLGKAPLYLAGEAVA